MAINRRNFINLTGITAATGLITGLSASSKVNAQNNAGTNSDLKNMATDVQPISLAERQQRVAKAQKLLAENNMQALVLDASVALYYFTGINWWPSERTMVAIIPASGDVTYICPAFEEARFREQVTIGKDVYAWQEDESPYQLIAKVLKGAGIVSGKIGIEEKTRFFIADGIQKAASHLTCVSADPITIPCRIIKSAAEIKLMQTASDITLAAIKHSVSQLREGMTERELSSMIMSAQNQLGGDADFALCLFGKSSAYPHGTKQKQTLKPGDIVLMDCGCTIERYNSDITRTVVFGEPTKRQREIWQLEKEAQAAGFAAAKIGAPCEAVDAAARKVITDAGFGPGYQLPGLPHRTGHGIGLEGHEWGNMVKGNKRPLEPGMCFSIEPTIAIMGEFGVRMEDCVYMTDKGPQWFSQPMKSIDEPFG